MIPESRRIHGRHPLLPRGGAAVDAELEPAEAEPTAARWASRARELCVEHGLGPVHVRIHGGHVTLAVECPPWLRYHAAVLLDLATGASDEPMPELRRDPELQAFVDRVAGSGRPWFADEHGLTVGVGRRSRTWSWEELPVDPSRDEPLRHCPLALVSGTNGKTTTSLMIAAIAWADGWLPGVATSTGLRIGRDTLEEGDWSGAEATRRILRHDRPNFAVLESARGGLLRRGLLVENADVAVLTNTSADHLGEYGIDTVVELARVKLLLADAVRRGGTLVIRAGDVGLETVLPEVLARRPDLVVHRFSTEGPAEACLEGDELRLHGRLLTRVDAVPLTLGGIARHNVENALAAALAAAAMGVGDEAIAQGLHDLRPEPDQVPGRTNVIDVRGATALVDYAHNPDGLRRLGEMSARWPARRRGMVLGQAGDRPDHLVLELAREAAALGCDRYVLKPLPGYARGRDPAEVVALLRRGLLEVGVPEERLEEAPDEVAAVRALAAWSQPGDLLLALVHEDLAGALDALRAV
ncbi:MAG: hypothetical protein H6735_23355 [Alphaproteobacteria bacterium]|nr:hypothetical protein [Alphaproteobacteria bacterium]